MRLIVILLLSLTSAAMAEVPANRLAVLSRGVNLIDIEKQSLEILVHDIDAIHHAGFRHIRFFVDPAWQSIQSARIDRLLQAAFAAKLGVIICMNSYTTPFVDDPQLIARWTAAWLRIATQYATTNPDGLFLELVNEPPLTDVPRWETIQETLRQQVRAVMPRHTLLLTSTPVSTSWALAQLTPSTDDNVVYAFHVYAPMAFTHQGAEWAGEYGTIRALQYPPTEANLSIVTHQAAAKLHQDLKDYGKLGKNIIDQEVAVAVDWAHKNNVHLAVTEFGVYRSAPNRSRVAWLHDVRTTLEKHAIGWSVWEFSGGFGIKPEIDLGCSPLSAALGLC